MKKKDKYMSFDSNSFDSIMFAIDTAVGYNLLDDEYVEEYEELTNHILENSFFVPEIRKVIIPLSEYQLTKIISALLYIVEEPFVEPELTYDNIIKRDNTKIFKIKQ